MTVGATVALALANASTLHAQQVGRTPVDIQVLGQPTALFALGRNQLVYELRLTNFGGRTLGLRQLEVLDSAGTVLAGWKDLALAQRISPLGPLMNTGASGVGGNGAARAQTAAQIPTADATAATTSANSPMQRLELAAGSTSVVYVWISMNQGTKTPSTLHHRLITQIGSSSDTIATARVLVEAAPALSMASPVTGGPWIALRGPAQSSGHRLSIVTTDGTAAIPQRYAVDWAKLGPDGRLFRGDSTQNTNWYGYGEVVGAVAAGTVVWIKADASEHPALTLTVPDQIEADDALGNAVIVDIGGGRFATYAHLKPGSVRVQVGERVRAGQPLGALGNSGNSLAPHLHFHVSSSPKPLGGDGRPYVLPSFELIGRVNSVAPLLSGVPWTPNAAQAPRRVNGETPLENMVVRFNP